MEVIVNLLVITFKIRANLNTFLLRIGRHIAWIVKFLMELAVLLQVFSRYTHNKALPWSGEIIIFLGALTSEIELNRPLGKPNFVPNGVQVD